MPSFLFRALFLLLPYCASAQLEDGSFAPDFTLQDLNGNSWHLYELLDSGKHVILDFSATWCSPCWTYHEAGMLNQAYSLYGPDGSDELMIFMIEADPQTNIDCLYDLPGCSNSTKGDWTAGTLYPIINDDLIGDVYQITGYPTHFHICPNKLISRTDRPNLEMIEYFLNGCAEPVGQHNASIQSYRSYSGEFCHSITTAPVIQAQNLGHQIIESATAECYINGALQSTITWEGHIIPFDTFSLSLPEITMVDAATVLVRISSVNGVADDDLTNNDISVQFTPSSARSQNILKLELKTNFAPEGVYWEVTNSDSAVLYKGGNPTVIGKQDDGGTYTTQYAVHTIQIPLPGDGCYKFSVYDASGVNAGVDYYKITGPSGEVLEQASFVDWFKQELFNIDQASHPIPNNAAINNIHGLPAAFCSQQSFSISIDLQNLGAATITQAELALLENDQVLLNFPWSGNISPGEHANISFPEFSLDTIKNIVLRITSVNGSSDDYTYQNEWKINLPHHISKENVIMMELKLDPWAYENYWQLANSSGEVLFAGGNTNVGPDGGGLKNASEGDPGAYAQGALVEVELPLPGEADCYTFLLVDSDGNGLYTGARLTFYEKATGKLIYHKEYVYRPFAEEEVLIEVDPIVASIQSTSNLVELLVYPNPVDATLHVQLATTSTLPLKVTVFNSMGEPMFTLPQLIFSPGVDSHAIDLHNVPSGMYLLQFVGGNHVWTRKVVVTD